VCANSQGRAWWIAAALALVVVIGFWQGFGGVRIVAEWLWLGTVGLLALSVAFIGIAVSGRPDGVLIDGRNRISLANFQATLWTLLVISALITAARLNLAFAKTPDAAAIFKWIHDHPEWLKEHPQWAQAKDVAWVVAHRAWVIANLPLEITIVPELLLAMGISAASFVGASAVLSLKGQDTASQKAATETGARLNLSQEQVRVHGAVFGRSAASLASWADMFRGDETTNAAATDLSKVQQFTITLLLIGIYGAALWNAFAAVGLAREPMGELPRLGESFVWLLAVSHVSYLIYKAAPKTPASSGAAVGDPRTAAVG
jgi:hypothetical protein